MGRIGTEVPMQTFAKVIRADHEGDKSVDLELHHGGIARLSMDPFAVKNLGEVRSFCRCFAIPMELYVIPQRKFCQFKFTIVEDT